MENLENKLPVIQLEKVICNNNNCLTYGYFDYCYLHVYVLKKCWKDFYEKLDDEHKEYLFDPNQFDLT